MQSTLGSYFNIDHLLPRQLRGIDDRWQSLQARVFILLMLVFLIPMAPALLTMGWLTLVGKLDMSTLMIATAFVMSGVVVCFYYFQRTGNLKVCTTIYGVLALLMMVVVISQTGGWKSPVAIYMLTLPVLFSMVSDIKTSVFYAILVLLLYVLLFLLTLYGFPFVQLATAGVIEITKVILWAATLLTIVSILVIYDYSEENLSSALIQERHRMDRDANCDTLTGLLNEQALLEKMQESIQDNTTKRALVYISVKNLSAIINQFGFETGDRFIQAVSALIHYRTPSRFPLARYSNDSFVIYMHSITDESLLNSLLDDITEMTGMVVDLADGSRFRLHLAVGTSLTGDTTHTPQEMIDEARCSIAYSSQMPG